MIKLKEKKELTRKEFIEKINESQPELYQGFKKCSKCGWIKYANLCDFYRDRRNKNGLTYWCKECIKKHAKKYKARMRKRSYKSLDQILKLVNTEIRKQKINKIENEFKKKILIYNIINELSKKYKFDINRLIDILLLDRKTNTSTKHH